MRKIAILFAILIISIPCAAGTIYVKQGGTGDGSSWADANGILQQAINAASAGDQVWVAKGTYKPTVEVGGSGDRYKTFQMKNGITIQGGYAGFGAPNPDDRNVELYETVLSGDIGTMDDPNDNCYHVFYHPDGLALDPNAIVNGFTITAGNANAGNIYPHNAGSGMFNKNNSPTVSNCIFSGNSAGERGGGMYNDGSGSSPTVTNCTFTGNSAGGSGGWGDNGGGGMFNRNGSPTVTNCTFSGNSAGYFGGGMYNSGSSNPTVTKCTFSGNSADLGGGMFNNDSSPTVTNCTFSGNSAGGMFNYLNSNPTVTNCAFSGNSTDYEGGGMYNDVSHPQTLANCAFTGGHIFTDGDHIDFDSGTYNDDSHPTVTNCTFTGNSADWGGGMYNYHNSSPTVSNCILWDNTAASDGNEIYNDPDTSYPVNPLFSCCDPDPDSYISYPANPLISYCDIAGSGGSTSWDPNLGSDANGNIDVNPLFVDANGPDGIAGTADDNLRLLWESPCIDAGDPNYIPGPNETDLDGLPRVIGGRIDMGSYEFLPNTQPVAVAGSNQIAYAWIDGLAEVTLDGSASYDDDNDVLSYYWSWTIDANDYEANGVSPTIELPVGEYEIELIVDDGIDYSESNYCTINVIEALYAKLFCRPKVINLRSQGKYIIAFLQLPPGITKDQIADEKLLLNPGNITAIRQFVLGGRRKRHKKGAKILAFFSKADLLAAIPGNGRTDLEVTGRLTTGQIFYGTDSIRIISSNRKTIRKLKKEKRL